jgi:hypothetical protein
LPKKPKKTKGVKALPVQADPSKKPKPAAKGGVVGERLRQAYTATQIKLMQRDLAPVDFDFSFSTLHAIRAYNEQLAHLLLQRKLDGRDHGSLQNGVGNAIRALLGPQGMTQTVQVNMEAAHAVSLDELTSALGALPLETQDLVINALKQRRIGIPPGGQAQPIEVR